MFPYTPYDAIIKNNKIGIKLLYRKGRRPLLYGGEFDMWGRKIYYCTFKLSKKDWYYKEYCFKEMGPNYIQEYENFVLLSLAYGNEDV